MPIVFDNHDGKRTIRDLVDSVSDGLVCSVMDPVVNIPRCC